MTRNLKAPKVIVLGDNANQGSVSDAIKSVIEKERGITIMEIREKDKYIEITNPYRYECLIPSMPNKIIFDKPKSKFYR